MSNGNDIYGPTQTQKQSGGKEAQGPLPLEGASIENLFGMIDPQNRVPGQGTEIIDSLLSPSVTSEEQAIEESGDMAAALIQEAMDVERKKKSAMALSGVFQNSLKNVTKNVPPDGTSLDQKEQDDQEDLNAAKALIAEHEDIGNFLGDNWENLLLAMGGTALAFAAAPAAPALAAMGALVGRVGNTGIQTWHSGYNKQIDALLGKFKEEGDERSERFKQQAVWQRHIENIVNRADQAKASGKQFNDMKETVAWVKSIASVTLPDEQINEAARIIMGVEIEGGTPETLAGEAVREGMKTGYFKDDDKEEAFYGAVDSGNYALAQEMMNLVLVERDPSSGEIGGFPIEEVSPEDRKRLSAFVEPTMDTPIKQEDIGDLESDKARRVFTTYHKGLVDAFGIPKGNLTKKISTDLREREVEPLLHVVPEGYMTVAETMYHVGKGIEDELEWHKEGGTWYLYGPLGVEEKQTAEFPYGTRTEFAGPTYKSKNYVKQIKLLVQGITGDDAPGTDRALQDWRDAVASGKGMTATTSKRFKIIYKNATLTE